jgi:uncharacterized protein (TIGR03118 family)
MRDRSRRIILILSVIVAILCAIIFGTQKTVVTAAGPSQFYSQHNLVSDGFVPADHINPDVVNAWGLVAGPTTPWWIVDNGTGKSTLYNVATGTFPLTVTVPGVGGEQGNPTGIVFNGGSGFVVNNGAGTSSARFIFDSEDGTISAFRGVPVVTVVPNAQAPAHGAIYKGLAIDSDTNGQFLYAADFHNGAVDIFDSAFHAVSIPGAFTDPDLPPGFAPFGIQNIDGTIYVAYALQDEAKEDEVAGPGLGFVDAFTTSGAFVRRVASMGELNAPWGMALAPADFGRFSGDLLVGNFGDGRINAFRLEDGEHVGLLHSATGKPIRIDGLWALQFGHGASANGPANTLFFTAGPADEEHGLFGSIVNVPPPGRQ